LTGGGGEMTKERLQSIPLEELEIIARNHGIDPKSRMTKGALIEIILDAFEEVKREREEQNNFSILGEEKKYDITQDEELEVLGDDIFPIPARYNENRLVFMIRDPNWAFAYWDIEDRKCQELQSQRDFDQLVLRIYDVKGLKFNGTNANSFFDIPIQFSDLSWYIYLPHQNCSYVLELGYLARGKYRCIFRSNTVKTPRGDFSEKQERPSIGTNHFELIEGFSSSGLIPQRIIARDRR